MWPGLCRARSHWLVDTSLELVPQQRLEVNKSFLRAAEMRWSGWLTDWVWLVAEHVHTGPSETMPCRCPFPGVWFRVHVLSSGPCPLPEVLRTPEASPALGSVPCTRGLYPQWADWCPRYLRWWCQKSQVSAQQCLTRSWWHHCQWQWLYPDNGIELVLSVMLLCTDANKSHCIEY